MKIAGREIANGKLPYIVAEIGASHGGDIKVAKQLIKEAKKAGAHSVKTQCYDADTLTLDCRKIDFIVQQGLWKGRTLYDIYSKSCTPKAWHKKLYDVARGEGITIFSSMRYNSNINALCLAQTWCLWKSCGL